jgi:phosphohistidine swiveling domain-containing protein
MSSQRNGLIPWTAHLEDISEPLVGGKAWNLFRLQRLGLPVPKWCVVPSPVFHAVLAPLRETIEGLLAGVDFTDQTSLDQATAMIRNLILKAEGPGETQGLTEKAPEIIGGTTHFSVRSSVVGEDSAQHSFAGLMDSFLNVPAERVGEAVRKVWASSFSSRALSYRHRKGLSLTRISAGVIIQEMVDTVAAGILFTADPESREATCVISAGFGLGEGVVSNTVETDTYRIESDLGHTSKEVAVKTTRIIRQVEGGTRAEVLEEDLKMQQVLSDQQIRELGAAGIKIEKYFGLPQDIEWAFDEKGRLFFLQARPIIFPEQATPGTVRIWDNSNIVEGYPGITLPLTFSFIRQAYEHLFRNATLSFLLFKKEIQKDLTIFENMVGLIQGRVYYNLLNWYRMMSYLPGYKNYRKAWDQMIGISERVEFPPSHLNLANRVFCLLAAAWHLLDPRRHARRFYAIFRPVYEHYRGLDFATASEDDILAGYRGLQADLIDHWHITLFNDFCAIRYFDWLQKIRSKWGPEGSPNIPNDLVCWEHGMESVAPVYSLVRIAEVLRNDPVLRELFEQGDNETVWKTITQDKRYSTLKRELEAYLQAYGDRGVEELKLEKPSFRDQPAILVGIIRNYCRMALSVEAMEAGNRETRAQAEAAMDESLEGFPLRRLLFRFVLRNSRRAIANRENMRFERSRVYGLVRRMFQRLGQLFAQKGVLERASDIFYLTVAEVFGFVEGAALTVDLKSLVALRQAEYAKFAEVHLKNRILTTGIPYLSSLEELEKPIPTGNTLQGTGCSSGVAEGVARVVLSASTAPAGGEYILVAQATDPGWVFLMIGSKGIVVERGSLLSHTAIIGRELGIPTIVSVKDATRIIPDGARLTIDGKTGIIRWQ